MLSILKKTYVPLASLFIFVIGSGLFTTLIALRLHADNTNPLLIGSMTTAYYLGLMLGAFRIERFIVRVGHIRAFSAFSSTLAVICILHGIFVEPWLWLLFRLMGGFATAGLLVVIESWLLIAGTINTRGQVLALYMITFYAAQALGQLLLNLASPSDLLLYAIAGMTASLAVIPLAMSRVESPQIDEPSSLNLKKLYHTSPTGVIGSSCAGLLLGALYGLMPIYFSHITNHISEVSWYMATIILGGMLLQYPIGRLSDYVDRRLVLIFVSLATAIVAVMMLSIKSDNWFLAVTSFLFGGLAFTLYPISISHTCDLLDAKDIVSGTQGLVLTYSIGACLGPLLAPIFIHYFMIPGIFFYYVLICVFLAGFFAWRKFQKPATPKAAQEQFVIMPQTTPVVSELDPRSEEQKS
ncbi:MAG: MFS transporter [Gammaproteobacteria bacterium]